MCMCVWDCLRTDLLVFTYYQTDRVASKASLGDKLPMKLMKYALGNITEFIQFHTEEIVRWRED